MHYTEEPREPDAVEFDVIAWLDNHGYDLLAFDLHAVIENRFNEVGKVAFLQYAAGLVRATRADNKDEALAQLECLGRHWTSFVKIYAE